ncbi:MAG: Ig-like domain-containing protein [Oscillospiraceae bacterium]|nr:Ig-like domain-containing protein [Oscillospiraceae bacterium]
MKKFLSILVALTMVLTVFAGVFAAPLQVVPDGYHGMAGHFRVVNESMGLVAIDVLFYGDHANPGTTFGNGWALHLDVDNTKLEWAMREGFPAGGIHVEGGRVGNVDNNGIRSNMLNTAAAGWANMPQPDMVAPGSYRIGFTMTSNATNLNYYRNSFGGDTGYIRHIYNPNTGAMEWKFFPSADGVHLFSMYFLTVGTYTVNDISQSDFALRTFGTDAPNGASFINSPPATIVNDNFIWVNFPHRITSSAGPNGTISPLGTQYFMAGTSATYTITANAGYEIDFIIVNGQLLNIADDLTTFTHVFTNINADQTIHVEFRDENDPPTPPEDFWVINATTTAGGTVSPAGSVVVADGATNVSFAFTANANYELREVYVNGVAVGIAGPLATYTYTFAGPITANQTIFGRFAQITGGGDDVFVTLTATGDAGVATINPIGVTSHLVGSTPTVTFTIAGGSVLDEVIVNGTNDVTAQVVYANGVYSFTFPALTANATIEISTILDAPPVITYPANNAVMSENQPTITVDAHADAQSVWVVINTSAGVLVTEGAATYNTTTNEWEFTPATELADGIYDVHATQTIGGNTSPNSDVVRFTVRTTIDPPAIATPLAVAGVPYRTNNVRQPITGTGIVGYTVYVEIRDTANAVVASGPVTVAADGTWSFTPAADLVTPDPYVAYVFSARARHEDATLNINSAWTTQDSRFSLKTAIEDPEFDDEFIGTENDPAIVDEERPTITGEGEPGATVTIRIYNGDDNDDFLGEWEVTVDANGEWSFTVPFDLEEDKTYRINIEQEDEHGNTSNDVDTWITPDFRIYRRISGFVNYDGFNIFNQVPTATVRLYNAANDNFVAETTASVFVNNGRFEFARVDSALTYYIVIHKQNHTIVTIENVQFDRTAFLAGSGTNPALIPNIDYSDEVGTRFLLFAGNMDAINDSEINTLDWSLLVNSMFQTHAQALEQDLTDDGQINVLDQSLLLNNFLQTDRVVQHSALTLLP